MLTGKDVYEATLFATSDIAGKWDKLSTFDKHTYEVAASVLNGIHIAPLQGLVKELEETLVYCWDNEFPTEDVEKLQARVKQLAGDVKL